MISLLVIAIVNASVPAGCSETMMEIMVDAYNMFQNECQSGNSDVCGDKDVRFCNLVLIYPWNGAGEDFDNCKASKCYLYVQDAMAGNFAGSGSAQLECPSHSSEQGGECVADSGYFFVDNQLMSGDQLCSQFDNAHFSSAKQDCECDAGYELQGESDCVPIAGQELDEVEEIYCGNHGDLVGGRCICDQGYEIYSKAAGCEPVSCGSNAEYDVRRDECICKDGYAVGASGKCIKEDQAIYETNKEQYDKFLEEQGVEDEDYKEKLTRKLIEYNQANSEEKRSRLDKEIRELKEQYDIETSDIDYDALEAEKEKRKNELEDQGVGKKIQPKQLTKDMQEVVDHYDTYAAVGRLNEKNGKVNSKSISPEKAKQIAQQARQSMPEDAKKTLDFVEQARTYHTFEQKVSKKEELYKKLEAKGIDGETTAKLLKKVASQLGVEEDGEDEDFDMIASIVSGVIEAAGENGMVNEDQQSILEQIAEGDAEGIIVGRIKDYLQDYAKENKHKLGRTVAKVLEKVEDIEQLGEMAGELGEKLGSAVEVYTTLNEAGETIHAYRTKLGGPAGDVAVVIYVTKEGAKVAVDHTIGKIPVVGDVLAENAKFVLDIPNKVINPLVDLNGHILDQYDWKGEGVDFSQSSEPMRFFNRNGKHRVENIAGGSRRVVTIQVQDPETKEIKDVEYNLNRVKMVKRTDEKGNIFYLPLDNTDTTDRTMINEYQFKRVDNTYALFFGCVELEVWTTGPNPVKVGGGCT